MDSLGNRIKKYESTSDQILTNRIPIIIRLDGKGFSKWTKSIKANKPFDDKLNDAMSKVMLAVAKKIDGCVFGFTQSDEITFVLRNDQSLYSEPWFSNRVQKMCSISASMFTANFARCYPDSPPAYFDSRVFAVPNIQEAINCLIWRQNDAVKNSISCACYYEVAKINGKKTARKMMDKLNGKQQQELLFQKAKINWNDYPKYFRRGSGCYRVDKAGRMTWTINQNLPIFSTAQDYLRDILEPKDEQQNKGDIK